MNPNFGTILAPTRYTRCVACKADDAPYTHPVTKHRVHWLDDKAEQSTLCRDDPEFDKSGIVQVSKAPKAVRDARGLTERERALVGYIVSGLRNRQIAMLYSTTEQYIKNQIKAIYIKTGHRTRLELAIAAVRGQWLADRP